MIPCLPWSALERVPGQAGVPALWRRVLGEHFDAFANAFLQRTSEMARSYPCPYECGCWHEVIQHTPESLERLNPGARKANASSLVPAITAVCRCLPVRCRPLILSPDDVVVWQLNWGRLGRALCAALGLDCRPSTLPLENTCQIGSWSTESVPVILTIQTQPERFRAVLAELGNRLRRRFILLAPTPDLLDAVGQELLANAGAGFFALTTHVRFTAHGGLQPVRTPGELFAAFTPQPAAALEEDTARRAFALAEQLGANALKVFRLYCIEGLSAAQAARLARCSRSAFYRRLELIRARTGMEPAQLRKLSPQLAQIEADLADSRASRIQRTRLIYDGEEEGE